MATVPVVADVRTEYSNRLRSLRDKRTAYERRHKQFGLPKILLAACALAVIVWAFQSHSVSVVWLLLPALAFVAVEVAHNRTLNDLKRTGRSIAFYERGMTRLDGRWSGSGDAGDRFLDPTHPYARDLDIFGKGSLFELLCSARTSPGRELLARWVLQPAPVEEVQSRQSAVTELAPRLDLREQLSIIGEDVRTTVRSSALLEWAAAPPIQNLNSLQVVSSILSLLWLASLLAWAVWGLWPLALLVSVVNAIFHSHATSTVDKIIPSEKFAPDLALLSVTIGYLNRQSFASPKLAQLAAVLKEGIQPPSISLRRITRLLESLESRRHLLFSAIDRYVLYSLQVSLWTERWRQKHCSDLPRWLAAIAEIETLSSLAAYAYEHPAAVFPQFVAKGPLFQAEGLAHPLLPESNVVRNDVTLGTDLRLIVISGPNMAGKSTFVRAVGINAVLAQCGAPVAAHRLRLSPLQVAASICILDSLQGGVSHFYAEISRLKLISDLAQKDLPVLFLLDELLSGTNSYDRRIGAEAVVKSLVAKNAVGLVTTHDLSLTEIAQSTPNASNFHFEDRLENSRLHFDYRLVPGIAHTTNALNLMRLIGLEL
jgi:MutS domain V/MutS domain III